MSSSKIPVLDLKPEIDRLLPRLTEAVVNVMKSGAFINGPEVAEFEAQVAAYAGCKHAVGLNSGTDALVIGLKAAGVGPGDEVITTSFSFFATAEAISLLDAKPVFVDIDPVTYNMDVTQIASRVTQKTKAIIPVHLYGHGADMDAVLEVAKRHDLFVLEDVAQAFSGEHRGKKLGTIGHAGALSFFPSKNLGAFGDAGMLLTNDDGIAERTRMLRAHGAKKKYFNEVLGYNSRLDTIQAAILLEKLPHLEKSSEGRIAAATRYAAMLAKVPGVVAPSVRPGFRHVFHQYTVRLPSGKRDAVKEKLAAAGIETMVYYPNPIHKLAVYASSHASVSLPLCEAAARDVLSLPIWPEISNETQQRVVAELARALGA